MRTTTSAPRPHAGRRRCAAILLGWFPAVAGVPATAGAEPTEPAADSSAAESQLALYEETHPYLYDEFSAGEGGTGGIDELEEIERPEVAIADTVRFDVPFAFVRGHTNALEDRIGLRLGTGFTTLGAWATGAGGDPYGASYDFDLMSAWTLVGRGTADTGVLVATVEYRDAFTDDPASALGGRAWNADQPGQRLQRPRVGPARRLLAAAVLR